MKQDEIFILGSAGKTQSDCSLLSLIYFSYIGYLLYQRRLKTHGALNKKLVSIVLVLCHPANCPSKLMIPDRDHINNNLSATGIIGSLFTREFWLLVKMFGEHFLPLNVDSWMKAGCLFADDKCPRNFKGWHSQYITHKVSFLMQNNIMYIW